MTKEQEQWLAGLLDACRDVRDSASQAGCSDDLTVILQECLDVLVNYIDDYEPTFDEEVTS